MTKSKNEPKAQQQPSKLRKEQSSWNIIVDTLPNNIPHPKTILLIPSSSVSSITIDPHPNKKDDPEQSRQLSTTNENKNNTKHNINCKIPSIKSKHQK